MPPRSPLLMLFVGGAVAFQKPGGAFQATPPPRAASRLRAATDVDVSDLKVAMDELDKPLEELTVDTRGVEHTSRTGIEDDGCAWTESNERVDVVLRIPGLRGQPSMSLAVDVTPTTCTVSSFGVAVWSCLLRGRADPASVAFDVSDGADAVPTIELRCGKADGARWNGFIESVGEDSIL
mmetsp:Transcript_7830/g.24657  ORF Transcript_7830/g.24657 Transcript_7830/m.24657 type:complete len:180 (-) Transcript_7830:50-589(-)